MIECLEDLTSASWGQLYEIWEEGVVKWPKLKLHFLSLDNEDSSWKAEWSKVSLIIKHQHQEKKSINAVTTIFG